MRRPSLLVLLLLLSAPLARGQATDAVQRGIEAYEDGRFAEAITVLGAATEADDTDSEAFYYLALALRAESPQQDLSRARGAVQKAVDLEPRNVVYMMAELEALREKSWNFVTDLIRGRRRVALANRLLAIDSTNAFAHEELASVALRDYYHLRNAVWTGGPGYLSPLAPPEAEDTQLIGSALTRGETEGGPGLPSLAFATGNEAPPAPPSTTTRDINGTAVEAARGNRFDLGAIRALGSGTYTERAAATYDVALYHLQAALETDPRRRGLYDDVLRLAAISGKWTLASRPLEKMYVHFPEDPKMWLYLGLANHRSGEWEAAAVAFKNGIQRMSEEDRAVFEDLSYVLSPREANDYRADPDAYAARFWSSRDPRFLNPYNERRLEHYARLTTADLLYQSEDLNLPGWKTERGEIHVRYGVPKEDVVIEGSFSVVLERYADRIEEYNTADMLALANRFNVWEYGDLTFVFEDPNRNGEYVLYAPPADLFGLSSARNVDEMDYVLKARSAFNTQPERFDFKPPGRHVDLPAQVTAFRGTDGRADVYVHYGVPLAPEATGEDGSIPATIKTGAFLVDDGNALIAERRKTVYGLRTDQVVPYADVQLWVASESVAARAGSYDVAVEFETADGAVSGTHRQTVDVPDFSASGLILSNLLLAVQIEEDGEARPGRIQRGPFVIQPAPWGVYAVGDPIAVYFEAYGLGLNGGQTSYDIEARLIPKDRSRGLARVFKSVFGGRARGVSTGFPVQGTETDDRQYVLLDATGQEPGLYTLTLRVEDTVTGQSAEREVDLLLE